MRLIALTTLTMCAFAANSVLTRAAIDGGASDPAGFAVVRVMSGAVVLACLVMLRSGRLRLWHPRRIVGAGALSLYMVGFSAAYLTLDAGLGALILFGVVQLSMFAASSLNGAAADRRQVAGAVVAMAGLTWVLWPSGSVRVDPTGAALMAAAGVGWAAYSLAGRTEGDPLAGTAANFVWALPVTATVLLAIGGTWHLTPWGFALAALSGGVASGLGYALWYRILPLMAPAQAAVVQLSVPVIAIVAGAVLLNEAPGARLVLGAGLVLGGILVAVLQPKASQTFPRSG